MNLPRHVVAGTLSAGCSPLPGFVDLQGHSGEGIRLILVAVWLHVHESVVPGTESQQDDLIFVVVFIVVFSSDESRGRIQAVCKFCVHEADVRLTTTCTGITEWHVY